MRLLGIDASGKTASAALVENHTVISEITRNLGLTHSETLLPMIDELLRGAKTEISDLDGIAVTAGPGSFTGLRIGGATAQGLALPYALPLYSISTLESLCYQVAELPYVIHPILDARRAEVYTASYFRGKLISEEKAISIQELADEINAGTYTFPESEIPDELLFSAGNSGWIQWEEVRRRQKPEHFFLGDGVPVYREMLSRLLRIPHHYALPQNLLQRASATTLLCEKKLESGEAVQRRLCLSYLRRPQAERERARRGLRDFRLIEEDAGSHSFVPKTEDRLKATNYVIGEGTGYENEEQC